MPIDIILLNHFRPALSNRFYPSKSNRFIPNNGSEKNMNNPVDPRKIPHFIKRLAKAGYILDVECSKREIRITYNRSASKYTTIPFGQTRLTDFQRGDLHGQNCSKLSHAA
jgi:hypothetical protein